MMVFCDSQESSLRAIAGPEIVALSGPLCAGKSSLAEHFSGTYGFVVRARDVLRELTCSALAGRSELQDFGANLEASSNGAWLSDWLGRQDLTGFQLVVIDAVRTVNQARWLRTNNGARFAHLTADEDVRRTRFASRATGDPADSGGAEAFDVASRHEIERNAEELAAIAELEIDTSRLTEQEVVARLRAWWDSLPRLG